jgi:Na+-driven multidrug efflux pump
MKANVLIGLVLSIVYMFVAPTIISVFINNDEVISFGTLMLRALMISPTFLGIMFVNEFAFQAMGKAKESLLLSISRQGFVFIPVLFVAKALAGLNGIILAQPAADIASVFISLWMYRNILRKDPILSQSQR